MTSLEANLPRLLKRARSHDHVFLSVSMGSMVAGTTLLGLILYSFLFLFFLKKRKRLSNSKKQAWGVRCYGILIPSSKNTKVEKESELCLNSRVACEKKVVCISYTECVHQTVFNKIHFQKHIKQMLTESHVGKITGHRIQHRHLHA